MVSVLGHVPNEVQVPGGYLPTRVVSMYMHSGCYKGTARVDVSDKVEIT